MYYHISRLVVLGLVLGTGLAACSDGTTSPETPTSPSPAHTAAIAYLDSAINILQIHAYYRARVDWTGVRTHAHELAVVSATSMDTYPAIRAAIAALHDGHSFLLTDGETSPSGLGMRSPPVVAADASTFDVTRAAGRRALPLDGALLDGRYGYLHVPTFAPAPGGGVVRDGSTALVDSLQALVHMVDAQGSCGWVVDLRQNGGGNMWPMLAGVAPILGDAPFGSFVDADGGTEPWFYTAATGYAGYADTAGVQVYLAVGSRTPVVLAHPNPPVAILTDSGTASSGEAIAVAFRGRPATRSFGVATYGVPTANAAFLLADGAYLVVTVAVDADRTGQLYDHSIAPDVPVVQENRYPGIDDSTVVAATRWLATQQPCLSDF